MLDSDNENELLNDVDYPSDEIASSSDSDSVQSDHVCMYVYIYSSDMEDDLGKMKDLLTAKKQELSKVKQSAFYKRLKR